MIRSAPGAPVFPGVRIHWLDDKPQQSRTEVLATTHSEVSLSVIVGDGASREQLGAALDIARTRQPETLCLLVMAARDSDEERRLAGALHGHCNALLVSAPGAQSDTARTLVQAIMTPLADEHPWCFDWNDMRDICTIGQAGHVARMFQAVGRGPDAASALVAQWSLAQAASAPLKLLVMASLRGPDQMHQHHEIRRGLANRGVLGDLLGFVARFDDALESGEVALTVVSFGPPDLSGTGVRATQAAIQRDLPSFLRPT